MATHGQALGVVSFYYDTVSAAAHGRHMIFFRPPRQGLGIRLRQSRLLHDELVSISFS